MKHAYAGILTATFAFILGAAVFLLYIVYESAPEVLAGLGLLIAIGVIAGTIDWYTDNKRKEAADGHDEEPPVPG